MTPLLIESWIWWSFVIVVAACRFISRRMTLGAFRRYQPDDYLMLVALAFYTTLIAAINIVAHTSSNLLPPGFDIDSLSEQDRAERIYGSKMVLLVEQCQCATIWAAKGCILILYLRITTFRKENIAIKILTGYVLGSYVIMEILYFAVWCRPFYEYWAVPTDNVQCDAATDHLITNTVFNLTSDCAMLIIGLPMFLRLQLAWRKKVPLIMIFSLGIFVILAAVLNKVYSFTEPFGSMWTYWYVRESSTALLVANLPYVWGVFKGVTGIKSQAKASRQNTLDFTSTRPGDLSSQGRQTSMATFSGLEAELFGRKGSGENMDLADALRCDSSSSLPRPGPDLTLEQILQQENEPQPEDGEINIYTHPLLFFSRARKERGPMEQSEHSTKRSTHGTASDMKSSGSSPTAQSANTMQSSTLTSLNSERSAGSFV